MESIDETILREYGGMNNNSLSMLLNEYDDTTDGHSYENMIRNSPYFDETSFSDFVKDKHDNFTVLSTNIESAHAKFNELLIYVEQLRDINFEFSVICLQESWLEKDTDISHLQIKGYTCIPKYSSIGRKGGLITYLNDRYTYKIKINHDASTLWEGQFLEISGNGLNKRIILGIIYRRPRDLIENYNIFINDISTILRSLEHLNSEILLMGDFNINLLKIKEKEVFADFLEMMTSFSYYPKITLPTRFSKNNGSLIDNIFCKISENTLRASSGILLKQFSDHQPYFICYNTIKPKQSLSSTVKITQNSPESLGKLYNEILEQNIANHMDTNPNTNPNYNYNKMISIIDEAKKKHMPIKIVKFSKHKHKKSEWITKGIIKSIKFRDKLHNKMKTTARDSPDYNTYKTNISTYNRILKRV